MGDLFRGFKMVSHCSNTTIPLVEGPAGEWVLSLLGSR